MQTETSSLHKKCVKTNVIQLHETRWPRWPRCSSVCHYSTLLYLVMQNIIVKQESILVGCILSACQPYPWYPRSRVLTSPNHIDPLPGHTYPPKGTWYKRYQPPWKRHPTRDTTTPLVNRETRVKILPSPQLRLRAVNIAAYSEEYGFNHFMIYTN